jgi:hypothetical protein
MRQTSLLVSILLASVCSNAQGSTQALLNPQIDYQAFSRDVAEAGAARESRRLTEEDFIRMSREPGTVMLDARSERLYRLRHIEGAVNLSYPDFTEATLAKIVPTKGTRILIYCNNNFTDAPGSMPVKAISAALNTSTFVSLHAYGYRNVYELGPAVEVAKSKLAFAGVEAR